MSNHSELLLHACGCNDMKCLSRNCARMKNLLSHGAHCQVRATGNCDICRRIWTLLIDHARVCQNEPGCLVPRCADLKTRWRQQQPQMDLFNTLVQEVSNNNRELFIGQDGADGTFGTVELLDDAISNDFEESRTKIGCDFIEFIRLPLLKDGEYIDAVILCDEYGRTRGSTCRANSIISDLRTRTLHGCTGHSIPQMSKIRGNVILAILSQDEEEEE